MMNWGIAVHERVVIDLAPETISRRTSAILFVLDNLKQRRDALVLGKIDTSQASGGFRRWPPSSGFVRHLFRHGHRPCINNYPESEGPRPRRDR